MRRVTAYLRRANRVVATSLIRRVEMLVRRRQRTIDLS
jgi:hypothetical protein